MAMISVKHLTFSYDSSVQPLFDDVSFLIDTNWKLGFTGRNGRGKTTFLQLLLGKYEYRGQISSPVRFEYFPCAVSSPEKKTEDILLEICPQAQEWELIRELSLLDLDAEVLERPFDTLSNGEQTKALLSALFLNEGRFLLIDEPTNHLDSAGRQKVSEYLRRKRGFILVSHDRKFLDGCVDHILSLNRASIEVQKGNFSSWMQNFQNQQQSEEAQYSKLKKEIGRMQKSASQVSSWSASVEKSKNGTRSSGSKLDKGYVGHKAAKLMKRSKNIETRKQKAIEQKSRLLKNAETAEDLKISPLKSPASHLATFSEVTAIYDGKPVGCPVSFEIRQGERVFLEGKNGTGKSSLLKILISKPIDHTGTITLASGLVVSYVPQDTSWLRGNLSDFAKSQHIDESLFKAILRKMDFDRAVFDQDMSTFSGGQRKKVLIAKSLCEQAHLYVWDEPLNFIDLYSRLQIEQLIQEFQPTMLLVEHDEAFRENIATQTINLQKG